LIREAPPCWSFFQASAIEIEQVCNKAHDSVQETAAIAVQPPGGGPEELVIAVVLKPGCKTSSQELQKNFSSYVMSNLNPLFKVRDDSMQLAFYPIKKPQFRFCYLLHVAQIQACCEAGKSSSGVSRISTHCIQQTAQTRPAS